MKTAIVALSVLVASMNVFVNEASGNARPPEQGCVEAALEKAQTALATEATKDGIYQADEAVLKKSSEEYSFDLEADSFSLSVTGFINKATYKIDVKLPLDGCDDTEKTDKIPVEVTEIEQGK